MNEEIRIGVSACLLGAKVRFDGGHKRDDFVSLVLARFVTLVPVCPEVELGLGTPREPIRLARRGDGVHLIGVDTGADQTEAMRGWARARVAALARLNLCGFILKENSPSCGMERVKLYLEDGPPSRAGVGMFAEELMRALPLLPVEEESRLIDPRLRESFVERVFAHRRLTRLFGGRWSVGDLMRFCAREKLSLMAHDPETCRSLGQKLARAKGRPREALKRELCEAFMRALRRPASLARHANVLRHVADYLEGKLSSDDEREIHQAIDDFRRGRTPLLVPLTLLRHHAHRERIGPLEDQSYLEPHPVEVLLRNHI